MCDARHPTLLRVQQPLPREPLRASDAHLCEQSCAAIGLQPPRTDPGRYRFDERCRRPPRIECTPPMHSGGFRLQADTLIVPRSVAQPRHRAVLGALLLASLIAWFRLLLLRFDSPFCFGVDWLRATSTSRKPIHLEIS